MLWRFHSPPSLLSPRVCVCSNGVPVQATHHREKDAGRPPDGQARATSRQRHHLCCVARWQQLHPHNFPPPPPVPTLLGSEKYRQHRRHDEYRSLSLPLHTTSSCCITFSCLALTRRTGTVDAATTARLIILLCMRLPFPLQRGRSPLQGRCRRPQGTAMLLMSKRPFPHLRLCHRGMQVLTKHFTGPLRLVR